MNYHKLIAPEKIHGANHEITVVEDQIRERQYVLRNLKQTFLQRADCIGESKTDIFLDDLLNKKIEHLLS